MSRYYRMGFIFFLKIVNIFKILKMQCWAVSHLPGCNCTCGMLICTCGRLIFSLAVCCHPPVQVGGFSTGGCSAQAGWMVPGCSHSALGCSTLAGQVMLGYQSALAGL
jgi:hypothetical protein